MAAIGRIRPDGAVARQTAVPARPGMHDLQRHTLVCGLRGRDIDYLQPVRHVIDADHDGQLLPDRHDSLHTRTLSPPTVCPARPAGISRGSVGPPYETVASSGPKALCGSPGASNAFLRHPPPGESVTGYGTTEGWPLSHQTHRRQDGHRTGADSPAGGCREG